MISGLIRKIKRIAYFGVKALRYNKPNQTKPNQIKTDMKELKLTMSKLRPMSAHIYQEMEAQTLKEIHKLN